MDEQAVEVSMGGGPGSSLSRAEMQVSMLLGSLVTVVGVLYFGWNLLLVLLLMLLELGASSVGLIRTVQLHQRATGDPAHLRDHFPGVLRWGQCKDFAEGLLIRTLSYPVPLAFMVAAILVGQASATLVEGVPVAISILLVAWLGYTETTGLRSRITEVPFETLRVRGIAQVYWSAGASIGFFLGMVWHLGGRQPLEHAIVAWIALKTVVELWTRR